MVRIGKNIAKYSKKTQNFSPACVRRVCAVPGHPLRGLNDFLALGKPCGGDILKGDTGIVVNLVVKLQRQPQRNTFAAKCMYCCWRPLRKL